MLNKYVIIVLLLFFIVNYDVFSKNTLVIGNTQFNGVLSNLNPYKFELALNFLSILKKDKIGLIPTKTRDSLIKIKRQNNINPNLIDISKELEADYIIFSKVNVLKNLVRTDITLVNPLDTSNMIKTFGWASANFKNDKEELIYDPAILASLQRALALAFKDSLMFIDSAKGFLNKPAPLLAIGGIYFDEDEKIKSWYIFEKKVVNSFDALETIFESAIKNNNYVTMDTETRDSIYNLNNLFVVENYNAPSEYELMALYKMGVEYYISGVLKRNDDGARLDLYLYQFDNGVMQIINSAYEIISEDSILLLRESLKYLTDKILNINMVNK